MSIQGIPAKFKAFLGRREHLLSGLIIVVSLASYGLGRASVGDTPSRTESLPAAAYAEMPDREEASPAASAVSPEGGYVASKSGTKYHLPWCGSAKQIKEENKIWFKTKEEAEAAGYTPAANCKGI